MLNWPENKEEVQHVNERLPSYTLTRPLCLEHPQPKEQTTGRKHLLQVPGGEMEAVRHPRPCSWGTGHCADGGAEGRARELALHLQHSRVDSRWSAEGAPRVSSLQVLRPHTTRHSPGSSTASTVLRPFPAADSSGARPCTPGDALSCRLFYQRGFEVLFQAATTQRIALQAAAAAPSLPSPSPALAPGSSLWGTHGQLVCPSSVRPHSSLQPGAAHSTAIR